MKIIIFGGAGTIGRYVSDSLRALGHEVGSVGRTSGDFRADFRDSQSLRELFERVGRVDAVASVAGEIAFKPFSETSRADWDSSLASKFLGQVQLATEATPFLNDGGSITLMTGVLSRDYVAGGTIATAVGRALEGFAQAVSSELPRGIRINVVSPTILDDSLEKYGAAFAGFEPTTGPAIARAYQRSILGVRTGQIIEVG